MTPPKTAGWSTQQFTEYFRTHEIKQICTLGLTQLLEQCRARDLAVPPGATRDSLARLLQARCSIVPAAAAAAAAAPAAAAPPPAPAQRTTGAAREAAGPAAPHATRAPGPLRAPPAPAPLRAPPQPADAEPGGGMRDVMLQMAVTRLLGLFSTDELDNEARQDVMRRVRRAVTLGLEATTARAEA